MLSRQATNYSTMITRPSKAELEEAEELVEESVEKVEEVLGQKIESSFALGFCHKEVTRDTLGGASGETLRDGSKINIRFNSEAKDWKNNLRRTVAHECAHTLFFQKQVRSREDVLWKVILGEAQATNLAEKCYPNVKPVTVTSVDEEELEKYWPEVRGVMDEKAGWNNRVFFSDFYDAEFPMYLGYALAFRIGEKLLEIHDLEDFPELEKEDVVRAGNSIFR